MAGRFNVRPRGPHIGRLLKFENVDLESVMVVEPTVIANGTKAGEK